MQGAQDLSLKTVDGFRQDFLTFHRWYRESRGNDLRWEESGSHALTPYRRLPVKAPENRATCGPCGLDTSRPSIPAGLFVLETEEPVQLGSMTFRRHDHLVRGLLPLSKGL